MCVCVCVCVCVCMFMCVCECVCICCIFKIPSCIQFRTYLNLKNCDKTNISSEGFTDIYIYIYIYILSHAWSIRNTRIGYRQK